VCKKPIDQALWLVSVHGEGHEITWAHAIGDEDFIVEELTVLLGLCEFD